MGRKQTTEAILQKQVLDLAASVGVDINFDPDKSLLNYRKGRKLLYQELLALPDGSVVWVWYKEHGEPHPRINGPQRIKRDMKENQGNYWEFEDGSSFVGAFSHEGKPDGVCFDEAYGEGETYLYVALPKK